MAGNAALTQVAKTLRQLADQLDSISGQPTSPTITPAGLTSVETSGESFPQPVSKDGKYTANELSRLHAAPLKALYQSLGGADPVMLRSLGRDLRTAIMKLQHDALGVFDSDTSKKMAAYDWYEGQVCEVTGEEGTMTYLADAQGDGHYVSQGVLEALLSGSATLDGLLTGEELLG